MDEKTILGHIHALVDEEHQLRHDHRGRGLQGADRDRLAHLERELDQAWDLLRQRRARTEAGQDPDAAHERSEGEVEGYRQ